MVKNNNLYIYNIISINSYLIIKQLIKDYF